MGVPPPPGNGGRSSLGTVSNDLPRRDKTKIVINCYRSQMRIFPVLSTTRLPDDYFTLPRGAKGHFENVLGLALYFCHLFDANSTYVFKWAF